MEENINLMVNLVQKKNQEKKLPWYKKLAKKIF